MSDTKLLAAQTAVRNMMQRGHVNICCIRDVCRLLSVVPQGDAYDILNTLHCVDFKDMPRELQERMPELLKEVFGGLQLEPITIEAETVPDAPKPNWLSKLLN
jgi:hypothetical protein